MKNPKEELRIMIKFDESGMPSLPDDETYPEWVIYAIEEWRTSLKSEKKKLGLSIPTRN